MIAYLGSLSLGAVVPALTVSLTNAEAAAKLRGFQLAQDLQAMQAELAALQADAAEIAAQLANPIGLAESLARQIAAGPTAVIASLQDAVAAIASGSVLTGLTNAIADGPSQILASLNAALAQAEAEAASLQAKSAALIVRVSALLARITEIGARITAVDAELNVILAASVPLASLGVHAYAFAGPVSDLPDDLQTELAGGVPGGSPVDGANALVLVTTNPATWSAMQLVFETA
jgi:hypothetical protein